MSEPSNERLLLSGAPAQRKALVCARPNIMIRSRSV